MQNLTAQLKKYLEKQNASRSTVKNYVSDFYFFCRWFEQYLPVNRGVALGEGSFFLHFDRETVVAYREYLLSSQTSVATTNRRLSSLRKIGSFGVEMRDLLENPAEVLGNVVEKLTSGDILKQFERFLSGEGVSDSTQKNYVSDVRQFLIWIEQREDSN